MNLRNFLVALLTGVMGVSLLNAKPAMRGVRTVTQPDGTSLQIKVVGDEHFHIATTLNGDIVTMDNDGFYRLATLDSAGRIMSLGISPSENNASTLRTKIPDIDIAAISDLRRSRRKATQTGLGLSESSYPTIGSPKGLILLVEYADVAFNESYDAEDYFNDMINGENFTQFGGTGSALQYFTEQSGGKFTPDFDVLGPVTLPNKRSYYGRNDWFGNDQNPHLMVTHAMEILDKDIDFSVYDTDGDGVIDNVFLIYAGQGEADFGPSDSVWPHSWDVRDAGLRKLFDGVFVGHYACTNEWSKDSPDGIGTFIHEFSHVLGLPDLYNTINAYANYTPGEYSVLDYGPYNNQGRTPPNYGAFERNALGWNEPMVLDGPLSVSLEEISSGSFGLIPTEKDTEFFLLENRQLTGWDAYIPNHGMLIWHIDYVASIFDDNVVNNTQRHQYVDLVEANNRPDWEKYAEGFTFPGTSENSAFTSETIPALKDWKGNDVDHPVTDIKEENGIIYFNVSGGSPEIPETPEEPEQPEQPEDPEEPELPEDPGVSAGLSSSDIHTDIPVYFNLQGVKVSNPVPGELIIEKVGRSIRKIIFK